MDGPRRRVARARDDEPDRFGFDEGRDWLREALAALVPAPVAHRAITANVALDRDEITPGETVTVTIEFANRLPVPVSVETPRQRLWGWTVDGELAASDERRFVRDSPGALTFRGGERKRITRSWNGRFEREGDLREWVDAEPGEYEIRAFVATDDREPSAAATVRVRS